VLPRPGQAEPLRRQAGEDVVKFWQRRRVRSGLQRAEGRRVVGVDCQQMVGCGDGLGHCRGQLSHRMRCPALPPPESGCRRRAKAKQRDDLGRAEPGGLTDDDREDQGG
jgi:hypothetical protein